MKRSVGGRRSTGTRPSAEAERAAEDLRSADSSVRLRAARILARTAGPSQDRAIRLALAGEDVAWVKTALRAALDRVARKPAATTTEQSALGSYREGYLVGVNETTRVLVHELEPILGSLRLSAAAEIQGYQQTRTRQHLQRLEDLIEACTKLAAAGSAPVIADCDLAELVREVVDVEAVGRVEAELAGPTPFLIETDQRLVRLALANGVRNATESLIAAGKPRGLTVTWNRNDREVWIAVLDEGVGPPSAMTQAFAVGGTTKPRHLGMGLAIASRAVESLGGQILLVSREDVGARLEIHLPSSSSRTTQ